MNTSAEDVTCMLAQIRPDMHSGHIARLAQMMYDTSRKHSTVMLALHLLISGEHIALYRYQALIAEVASRPEIVARAATIPRI